MSIHILNTVYILVQISTNLSIKFLMTSCTFVPPLAVGFLMAFQRIGGCEGFFTPFTRKCLLTSMYSFHMALETIGPCEHFTTLNTTIARLFRRWLLPVVPFSENLLLSLGWPRKCVHSTKLAINLIIFQLCNEMVSPTKYRNRLHQQNSRYYIIFQFKLNLPNILPMLLCHSFSSTSLRRNI
jgi:hypothetical protein